MKTRFLPTPPLSPYSKSLFFILTLLALTFAPIYFLKEQNFDEKIQISLTITNILIASVAVFSIQIHSFLAKHPRLEIAMFNKGRGEPVFIPNHSKLRYYHLVLKNCIPGTVIRNSALYLTGVQTPKVGGGFNEVIKIPPIKMVWPYEQDTNYSGRMIPRHQDIQTEVFCDCFFLGEHMKSIGFPREIHSYRSDAVLKNLKHVKLYLEFISDNYPATPVVVEINWTGAWHDDEEMMAKEVSSTVSIIC